MKEKYQEDLAEIRSVMHRSSRFLSLSGTSGIVVGFLGLAAAYLAYELVFRNTDYLKFSAVEIPAEQQLQLVFIAAGTLIVSIVLTVLFTARQSRNRGESLWNHQSRRILYRLAVPLLAGGVASIILFSHGYIGLVIPLLLLFYGLGLFAASGITYAVVEVLGITQLLLGLLALLFVEQGIILWAAGFGVAHIVYGLIVRQKYKL